MTPSTGDKQPQYRRHCGDAPHRVRVMIVEDSAVVREFLQHAIGCDRRLQLVASVRSAEEALRCVEQVSPDVISMDIRLPGMNGFEATRRIMADCPTPIVVVAASVDSEDLQISMNALRAGALAVLEKPAATTSADYAALGEQLCTRLVIMSQVNVVRQRFAVQPGGASALTERRRTIARRRSVDSIQMVGMVASTGGPNALDSVLKHFTRDFPTPIAIVQHITASFQDAFVAWLRDISPLPVKEAAEAMRPEPGVVYVAPAERHLVVEPNGFRLDRGEPVCLQRPSGTILLKSIAASYGSRALGVLLTGMGEDGAAGLHALYDADAQTIAEDESTAVVYGMPAAAMRLGAVRESLPLHEIGPRIMELIAR
ncbi:MAG TPA: chemotaxis-specific protein-glutamate methyltransferase CheB [Pirellulales bacterium]|nr:chemotaxis-specific protein-glutamate methyltransferase CheB [Pirellulales bacterium]